MNAHLAYILVDGILRSRVSINDGAVVGRLAVEHLLVDFVLKPITNIHVFGICRELGAVVFVYYYG